MERLDKIKGYIFSHPEIFTVLGLGVVFYFLFFHNIGTYALMDVDETRYVSMSKDMFNTKDFLTLYLNNEFFFEKPPLYFWGECLSFAIFGKITEFTARFPVALYGTACAYLIYFVGKRYVSRFYGVVASLILATSLEFIILAKFAILDIVVSTCICFSVCFGMLVFNCKESNKKYYWWLFYIFSGLAVLAKGIPGFVIPFGSMFLISIFEKKFKEIFKPVYILPGIILFLLIVIPWHYIMLKMHNPLFWDEYVIKHHIARFLGKGDINRTQPFYFYFLTILWGFFPWIVSCLTVWIKNLVKVIKSKNYKLDIANLQSSEKFLIYNAIVVLFTLLFFSSSETKLITYILPVFAPLACLGAYVWCDYINKNENQKMINIGVNIIGGILILASVVAIFTPLFLPEQLNSDISIAKTLCITLLFSTGLGSILFAKKKINLGVFVTYVLFMTVLSAWGTPKFFNVDYKFGQNDLLQFAEYAKQNNFTLTTYKFGHKYSLIYYGDKPVEYGYELTPEDLPKVLRKENNLLIIKKKDLKKIDFSDYDLVKEGRRYLLIDKEK